MLTFVLPSLQKLISSGNDYYYTLRDVIFFLENVDLPVAEYRKRCLTLKVAGVVEQDRQNLKSYLTGEIDSCPQIDLSAVSTAQAQLDLPSQQSRAGAAAPLPPSWSTSSSAPTVAESSGNMKPPISLDEMQLQLQRHVSMLDKSLLGSG
jgi:hypothetical protein